MLCVERHMGKAGPPVDMIKSIDRKQVDAGGNDIGGLQLPERAESTNECGGRCLRVTVGTLTCGLKFNPVVSEAELFARGWPDARPTSNALRVHLHRLRRGARSLGLDVLAVHKEGWVLQLATSEPL
jgi:hypothetical protein